MEKPRTKRASLPPAISLPALLAAALMAACTALPGPAPRSPETAAALPGKPPETQAPAGPVKDSLDTAAFTGLPAEARAYLKTLATAFSGQDRAFLLAQGEALFEKEVRPRHDEETYLALLYRIGPLDADSPDSGGALPRLFPENIRGIEYRAWEEEGPLLNIRGRLIPAAGSPIPCRIMLVWRLREPKIEGLFP